MINLSAQLPGGFLIIALGYFMTILVGKEIGALEKSIFRKSFEENITRFLDQMRPIMIFSGLAIFNDFYQMARNDRQ